MCGCIKRKINNIIKHYIKKTYIELWSAIDSGKSLSKEERQKYLEQIGPALQGLMEQGVEMVSWGVNQNGTFARANYDFFQS